MRLLDNLYQVGGPCLTHDFDAASYVLKSEAGSVLIDCGTPEGYEQLKANVKKIGCEPGEIKMILGTHGHYDHVGAAKLWKEEYGSLLKLHPLDIPQVEQGDDVKTTASLLYGTKFPACPVDGTLNEGETLEVGGTRIEVIYTPGHTTGSVCFDLTMGDMRILIAGDTLWGGFSDKIGSSEDAWKESLKKITARHYDAFTFGHVNPQLIADADTRLREAQKAFANYYNPWFKTFADKYRY